VGVTKELILIITKTKSLRAVAPHAPRNLVSVILQKNGCRMKKAKLYEYRILDPVDRWDWYYNRHMRRFVITFICMECSTKHTLETWIDTTKLINLPAELTHGCLCGEKIQCIMPEELVENYENTK